MTGLYILILELPHPTTITTRRRAFALDAGFYAYVGSAMNGLEARIARHQSPDKKRHWHIDYLLDHAAVRSVLSAETNADAECLLAGRLSDLPAVAGFGCSDCRCRSHLFFSPDLIDLTSRATGAFRAAGLDPRTMSIGDTHRYDRDAQSSRSC
ncbi:GIY-YIG nuclease family protein [Dehalogenimonas alkenigignens]|uniref:GIY-YIG nuclease family protein n=1 Tax=Dehalogenimonas alkenigignens TaxID=1217799 RepID=UPI000D56E0C2|nr:GIY-YIG nuclease family protein [Dehalogenimonas alkenigignens]PVV84265.1 DUF123 domain-containing protein [Dehalogenimonas alkenigignens]